jgi:poly(A) polymerase
MYLDNITMRFLFFWAGLSLVVVALSAPACADSPSPAGDYTLRILTYNIRRPDNSTFGRICSLIRGESSPQARTHAILWLIHQQDPDIIALQEVTPSFVKALNHSPWRFQYDLIHTLTASQLSASYYLQEPDGMAILSKHPMKLIANKALIPSKLRRRLLVVEIEIGGSPIRVGVCHLDSFDDDGDIRALQLKQFFNTLAPAANAVLLGDFNFGDNQQPETGALDAAYMDSWLVLHPADPGPTYQDRTSHRLDRILVRAADWIPTDIRLVGTERITIERTHEYPSDHYGVLATMHRR